MQIEEFKIQLKSVDFFYEYQDSFENLEGYKSAKKRFEEVRKIANENVEFKKLFDEADPMRINNN